MPFSSQAQAGWAFANRQPWAKRWARETGPYKRLPYKVRKKALAELATTKDYARAGEIAEALALKGTKLAPGVTRIQGDLCNVHGRWGSCRAAGYPAAPGASKPFKAKPLPKVTSPKPKKAGGKKRAGRGGGKAPSAEQAKRQEQRDRERAEDRAYQLRRRQQVEADREERLRRQRQRDEERAADRAKREAEQAKKPVVGGSKKPAAGGSKKPAPREPRKAQPRRGGGGGSAAPKGAAPGDGGGSKPPEPQIPQALRDAVQTLSDGGELDQATIDALMRNGLARLDKNGKPFLTGQGLRILSRQKAAPDVALAIQHLQQAWGLHREHLANPNEVPTPESAMAEMEHIEGALTALGAPPTEPATHEQVETKAFTVFKDASGAYRWLARTTTAYEDRDGEVISVKALQESADSSTPRGPLRWWHSGAPDPLSDQPWGAGVDLGWCDFAALHGRTLIESGTFKSAAIARAVAAKANQLELSPGFFHAPMEPDASGVFHHIRIFERSLVPTWAGRASNYYTGLKVQGGSMDEKKMQALKELGAGDDVIAALLGDVQQAEKAADAQGVRYKAFDFFRALFTGEPIPATKEEPEPVAAPLVGAEQPAAEAIAEDPLATLKAELASLRAELATLKEGDAPPPAEAEAKAGGMMGDMPMEGEGEMMEEEAGGLTLSPEDLAAIGQAVASALEPLIGALGITQKLEGHLGELKTMMGGYVKQKDDEAAQRQDEIAALKASIDQQQSKLSELLGDQPRAAGYRPSQAADNTLEQLQTAVKGAQPGAFDDLVGQFFPGMLPG